MPTIATRSLMPLLLIERSSSDAAAAFRRPPSSYIYRIGTGPILALRPYLPEVVVYAPRRVHAAERHLHLVADLHPLGLAVGHLAEETAPAREIDDDVHRRRVERVGEAVEREGRDLRG